MRVELTVFLAPVLLAAIGAAWDVGCKWVAAKRFNVDTLESIANLGRELEKQHQQQQQILAKLGAVGAAANRVSRIGTSR